MTEKTGHFAQFFADSNSAKVKVIVNRIILVFIVAVTTTRRGGSIKNRSMSLRMFWAKIFLTPHILIILFYIIILFCFFAIPVPVPGYSQK